MTVNTENGANGSGTSSEGIREDLMEIDGLKIGYCVYGNGPNRILCICGAVGSYAKDFPLSVLEHFDPTLVTMVCIDPPGYGKSRPPDRKQEVNRCMKDSVFCLKLMQGLNMTPFTVLGWSEGARTAIHVAGKGKDQVNRMILLAAGSRVTYLGAMAFGGMKNTDQWLASGREPYLQHYSNEFLKKQWADLCDVVQQVYDFCGGRFPSDLVLPSIKVPSLILNGGQDRFCGDAKTCFLNVLKNSRLEVHAQGRHDFYLKYPKWFAEKVQHFIKENK